MLQTRPPAWAAAFASITSRLCGIYGIDPEQMLRTGGLYTPEAPAWQEGGLALLSFRLGGHAAEEAFKSDPLFCAHPATAAGEHAGLVARYLTARAPPNHPER